MESAEYHKLILHRWSHEQRKETKFLSLEKYKFKTDCFHRRNAIQDIRKTLLKIKSFRTKNIRRGAIVPIANVTLHKYSEKCTGP